METYDHEIAGSANVALIHVSYDKKDSAALKWALDAKMKWPTILAGDRKASGMEKFSKSEYIPEYRLYHASGKEVALKKGETAIEAAAALASRKE